MTNLLILAAAAAASPAPARAAATAATVVITAPRAPQPAWESGEAAERYRLRGLPPEPPSGARRINPIFRLAF